VRAGVVPVIYGPGSEGFHGDNECVEIKSLIEATKVIAAAIPTAEHVEKQNGKGE